MNQADADAATISSDSASTSDEMKTERHLSGTWEIQGQPEPACGVQPFTNLISISRHGRIVNVDPEIGTGVGEAHRVGFGRYVAGYFGFIHAGGNTLICEVQSSIKVLDSSNLTGSFRTIVSDLAANVQRTYIGTMQGHRLVPQPFPGV